MRRIVRAIANALDVAECPRCGAPPEDRHADCWRVIFDWLRDWTEPKP